MHSFIQVFYLFTDAYRRRPPLMIASPGDVPARQLFVHTRQAPPAAVCVNKAHGLPPASRRGSRLPSRPGEAGAGATAARRASGAREPATPSSPAGAGIRGQTRDQGEEIQVQAGSVPPPPVLTVTRGSPSPWPLGISDLPSNQPYKEYSPHFKDGGRLSHRQIIKIKYNKQIKRRQSEKF